MLRIFLVVLLAVVWLSPVKEYVASGINGKMVIVNFLCGVAAADIGFKPGKIILWGLVSVIWLCAADKLVLAQAVGPFLLGKIN